MGGDFSVEATTRNGVRVVSAEGELDLATAPVLAEALDESEVNEPVVVDFTRLTYIDSAGIHLLLRPRDRGQPAVVARKPDSPIARVMEIVEVDKNLPVVDRVEEAIEAVRVSGGADVRPDPKRPHRRGFRRH